MRKFTVIFVLLLCMFLSYIPKADAASSQLIIINKKTNTLAFYDSGKLVRTFSVATGRTRDLTPEGTFRIVNKIVNRPYYTGGIPGGDPRNPLGNRWLGLEARGTYGTTYAIHGNNNESSIGKYVSSGCVRMHNDEVRWLFDRVKLYTPVIITYSSNSFDVIAKEKGYLVESNGWVKVNGNWYYYEKGVPKTGWLKHGGQWYYLDKNGVMKTGWVLVNNKWYYLQQSGAMRTGWLLDRGTWYYLDQSGAMKTGWLYNGGAWYYLKNNGAMKTGWLKDKGTWYYLKNNGAMKTGWLLDKKKWYYLDKSGAMKIGWLNESGKKYYLDNNGAMVTGWLKYENKWYYYNNNGVMKTGWLLDKKKWYYLDKNGAMRIGWLNESGQKYYLDNSGAMVTGWLNIENKWYYFQNSGALAVNTIVDGYKVGKDGARIQYVALGDSLAAGITPENKDDLGYPDYIADNFGKDSIGYKNLGVPGYTSIQLKADVQNNKEIQKLIAEATHITIDIGANDLLPLLPDNPDEALNPTEVMQAIGDVSKNIDSILGTIDKLNPNVNVYVMGYYNAFPYYPEELQKQLLPLIKALNDEIKKQAIENGDTFVATDTVIASDFTKYIPNPDNIHLSTSGYQVIAGEFWKVMK
ncbi:L,D-transpeptidase family protein [Neobacillus sedimentimangrovi]|jgi:glucan-binding YG repeat protein/lysophospholipase L1-like esterase|uniref:L,D-transpeptidase family protein n=1 Tax=Neobacillus sedimentimangrovi TaxID=2699460 RepID=A0ABS8QFP5_9BACI|nr:L,D-transpeptidase family protein [Neobacillus sedimentimangrovi]MCD4838056.1 L,D-transpeptidase family protein [Neobacillus sedimentimangrovi]